MSKRMRRYIAILLSVLVVATYSVPVFALEQAAADSGSPAIEKQVEEQDNTANEGEGEVESKAPEQAPAVEEADASVSVGDSSVEEKPSAAEKGAEEAAFSEKAKIDGMTITVSAAKGVFPAGATLEVKKANVPKAVDTDDAKAAYAYDISILGEDGEELQPEGKAEVAFKSDQVAKYDTSVYHMDGKKAEEMDVTEKGKTATVETEGFSLYVVTFTMNNDNNISPVAVTIPVGEKVYLQDIKGVECTMHSVDQHELIDANLGDDACVDLGKDDKGYYVTARRTGVATITLKWSSATTSCNYATTISLTAVEHTHTWALQSAGNKAYLKCTTEDCPYNTEPVEFSLSTAYDSAVYSGDYLTGEPSVESDPLPPGIDYSTKIYFDETSNTKGFVDAGNHKILATLNVGQMSTTIETPFTVYKAENPAVVSPIEGLFYDGTEKVLVTTVGDSRHNRVTYSLTGKSGSYSDTIPTGKEAGTYTVYYKAEGGSNYLAADGVVEATIHQLDSVRPPIAVRHLVYNGALQKLIAVEGRTPAGVMQYALTKDNAPIANDSWKTEYSQIMAANPGEYTVYYRVVNTGTDPWVIVAPQKGFNVTIHKADADFTVEPIDGLEYLEYNGHSQSQKLVRAFGDQADRLQYRVDGGDWSSDIPTGTEAGTYVVDYRIDNEHSGGIYNTTSGTLEVEIAKADSVLKTAPTGRTNVYNGKGQELVIAADQPEGGELYFSLDNKDWSKALPKARNVGEYTVYYKVVGDKNHNDTEADFVKARIVLGEASGDIVAVTGLTYDGQAHRIVSQGTPTNGIFVYRYSKDEEYTEEVPTATDAGEYRVYYKVAGDEGYKDSEEKFVEVTIAKREIRVAIQDTIKKYGTEDPEFGYLVSGLVNGEKAEDVVSGSAYRETSRDSEDPGVYKIHGNFDVVDNNYKFAEADPVKNGKLEIVESDDNFVVVTAEGWTYGDDPVEPVAIAFVGTPVIKWSANETDWTTWTLENHPENAGQYKVKAVVTEAGYEKVTDETTLTIEKADSPVKVTPVSGILYGQDKAIVTVTDVVEDENMKVTYSVDGNAYVKGIPTAKGLNAGKHTVAWKSSKTNNYKASEGLVEVKITKADAMVTAPSPANVVYNGSAQNLLESEGTVAPEGTLVYSLDGEDWNAAIPQATKVGEYKVYYKFAGNDNYKASEPQYVVANIESGEAIYMSGLKTDRLEYNGKKQPLVDASNVMVDHGTLVYRLSEDEEFTSDIPYKKNAGDYTVYYKVKGDEGYKDSDEMSVNVKISRKQINIIIDNKVKEYGTEDPEFTFIVNGLVTGDDVSDVLAANLYREESVDSEKVGDHQILGLFDVLSGNYRLQNVQSGKLSIVATDGNAVVLTAEGWTYGNDPVNPTAYSLYGTPEIFWTADGEAWQSWTLKNHPEDAGQYTVRAEVAAIEGYERVYQDEIITISKADSPVEVAPTTGIIYGQDKDLVSVTGIVEGENMTVKYSVDGGAYTNEIPNAKTMEAGKHTVVWKSPATKNYNATEGSVEVKIAKADVEVTAPVAISSDYTGEAQALLSDAGSVSPSGSLVYSLNGEDWNSEIPSATEAGEYRVYYKFAGNDNYKSSEPQYVTAYIIKVDVTAQVEPVDNLVYNGKEQTLVKPAAVENGKVVYRLSKNDAFSADLPKAKDAGSYTVYYKVKGDEGYADSSEKSVEVKIATKQLDIYIDNKVKAFGASDPEFTYGVIGVAPQDNEEDVVSSRLYRQESADSEEVGEHEILGVFKLKDDNYSLNANNIHFGTLTIVKSTDNAVVLTAEGWTYGDTPIAPTAEAIYGTPVIYWTTSDAADESNLKKWTVDEHPEDAGQYVVVAKVAAVDGYDEVVDTKTITIEKAENPVNVVPATKIVYGQNKSLVAVSGTVEGSEVTFSVDGGAYADTTSSDGLDAGKHTVDWKATGTKNYKPAEGTVEVKIAKDKAVVVPPVASKDLEYTGSAQQLLESAASVKDYPDAEVLYSLDGENWGAELPEATEAGTYKVYYVFPGNDNLEATEERYVTAYIAGTPVEGLVTPVEGLVYNGEKQTLITVGDVDHGHFEYRFTEKDEYSADLPKGKAAGTYTIYYKFMGEAGFADSKEGVVEVTIAKKEVKVFIDNKVKEYGAEDPEFTYAVTGLVETETADDVVSGRLYRQGDASSEELGEHPILGVFEITDANYTLLEQDIHFGTLTIVTADDNFVALTAEGWTYGEEPVTPTAMSLYGDPQIFWTADGETWNSWTVGNHPEDAGQYTVRAEVAAGDGHKRVFEDQVITIQKAVSPVEVTAVNGIKVGDDKDLVGCSGAVEDMDVTFSLEGGDYGEIPTSAGLDAGTYSVAWKSTETKNYKAGVGEVYVFVGKGNAELVKAPTPIEGLEYNGKQQVLVEAGEATNGTMVYSLSPDGPFLADLPRATAAGDYYVYYKVKGDDNYQGIKEVRSVYVNIAEKAAEVVEPEGFDRVYDGVERSLIIPGQVDHGTILYSVNDYNSYSEEVPTATEAGQYFIAWKVVGDADYAADQKGIVYSEITPRELSIRVNNAVKAYGDEDPEFTFNVTAGLLPGVKADDVIEGAPYRDTGDEDAENVGKHTIYGPDAFSVKDSNYAIGEVENGTLTITSANNKVHLAVFDAIYGDDSDEYKPVAKSKFGDPVIYWFDENANDWVEWSVRNHPVDAGKYAVMAVVNDETGNVKYKSDEAEFTIYPKDAFVILGDRESAYREEIKGLEYNSSIDSVTGLEFGDSAGTSDDDDIVISEITTTATDKSPVGEYPIYAKATSKNYDVTVIDGTYRITKAKLKFKIEENDVHATYDGYNHGINVTVEDPREGIDIDDTDYHIYWSLNKEIKSKEGAAPNMDLVAPRNVGEYSLYFYIDSKNYEPEWSGADLVIERAILRVAVKDQTVTYGDLVKLDNTDEFLTIKAYEDWDETKQMDEFVEEAVSGLDDLKLTATKNHPDGTVVTYTDQLSEAGIYSIKTSALHSSNYLIKYATGKLDIKQKALHFTWSADFDHQFKYDGKEHSVYAATVRDELVETDKADGQVVILYEDDRYPNGSVAHPTGETNVKRDVTTWDVLSYSNKVNSLAGPRGDNYTIAADADTVWNYRIVPERLVLTPNPVEIQYGEDPKDNGFSAAGFINGDTEDVIKGVPAYTFDYEAGDDAGKYQISFDGNVAPFNDPNGVYAQNYQLNARTGVLNVLPREISIEWGPKGALTWGPSTTFEYDGQYHEVCVVKVNNEYGGNSAIDPTPIYAGNKAVNAGSYTATVRLNPANAKNYKVIGGTDSFDWKITKRPATIYAKSNTIQYGQAPAFAGYNVDKKPLVRNVENGNALDKIGNVFFRTSYKKNGKVGTYQIVPVVVDLNPNYYIAGTKNGALTVNYKQNILLAQGTASGKTGVRMSWNGVSGAASYDVYFSHCDTAKKIYTPKKIANVKGKSYRVGALKKHHCYKFYIVAKDKSGKVIAKSKKAHVATAETSEGFTNTKTISVTKKNVTISKGGTYKVNAKLTKVKSKKKLLDRGHDPLLRYVSAKSSVASVSGTGVITGVSKGWCKVYVQAVNGKWCEIQVTVK